MTTHNSVKLVSSELANIWKLYQFETLNRCMLQHFLETVEDRDIKNIIQIKLEAKEVRIQQIASIFNKEEIPTPVGFTEKDVHLKVPRLFTDVFMAEYIYYMAIVGLESYARAMSISPRADVRHFFYEGMTFFGDIQNKIMDLLLQKGIFTRPPYIPYPTRVDFVKEQSFLTGWFGERRSLHCMQITHLFFNLRRNAIGKELLIGFSQTAQSEEVREYMVRGKEITNKLIHTFHSILVADDITPPTFGGMVVTESKIAPFSDKLMLSLITFLDAFGMATYGLSLSESTRRDLFAQYTKIIAQIGAYGEDGINLMIKYGYFEQPPKAPDRNKLSQ
ncbi:DUF3231 family protein [Bacillus luteolus]|uniref:DUF3231 family protein n=1 Tax=Litchfieldia luteola TaxID=682179 RepID=A0ABR9QPR8_9BACI|nr:DUF3231 family protein [Cytobacillus luteolus]MBE4910511.1 DUF3231 family protein [Cytobacillus luteolus]MBP1943688.1 hypothetical protein [Cytobacillus luteolus]